MSLDITVSIPTDVISSIRAIDYDLERIDGEVEFTLATITSAIIQSVKGLPAEAIPSSRSTSLSGSSTYSNPFVSFRSCSSGSVSSRLTVSSSNTGLGICYYDEFELAILDPAENRHFVMVTGNMTIEELKNQVRTQCNLDHDQMTLLWKTYRLNQPEATLSSYGIRRGAQLELLEQPVALLPAAPVPESISFSEAEFSFKLQTISGTTLVVSARHDTTTAELATAVWERESIFPSMQLLVCSGATIYDGCEYANGGEHLISTLQEAGVSAGCTVHVQIAKSD